MPQVLPKQPIIVIIVVVVVIVVIFVIVVLIILIFFVIIISASGLAKNNPSYFLSLLLLLLLLSSSSSSASSHQHHPYHLCHNQQCLLQEGLPTSIIFAMDLIPNDHLFPNPPSFCLCHHSNLDHRHDQTNDSNDVCHFLFGRAGMRPDLVLDDYQINARLEQKNLLSVNNSSQRTMV